MNEKQRRQQALRAVIAERPVSNQQQIVRILRKGGVRSTQASISRDIRELGLVKINGRYTPTEELIDRGRAQASNAYENELITRFEPIGANLIIVRTRVGAAGAVGVEIDSLGSDDIAGTVAGDDTLFIAVRSRSAQGRVVSLLQAMRRP